MSREREPIFIPLFIAASVGFNLCNLIRTATDNSDELVRQVQIHNPQIREQLIPTYKGLGELILDEEHDTFVFTIHSVEQPDQSCSGSFEVQKDVAVPVGSIACTTEQQVGGK